MSKSKKPASGSKKTQPANGNGNNIARAANGASRIDVSIEQRRRMIEEAAYYRALNRGFQGGDPLADWIAAEMEIERQLPATAARRSA